MDSLSLLIKIYLNIICVGQRPFTKILFNVINETLFNIDSLLCTSDKQDLNEIKGPYFPRSIFDYKNFKKRSNYLVIFLL